jgi:hypothetical protein
MTREQPVLPNPQTLRTDGFLHDTDQGRVECRACGARVFSRNPQAIAMWQLTHAQFCRGAFRIPPASCDRSAR